ncbi:ATP-dependent DNA helicase PIF1 [Tanacetum coccineum]
MDTAIEEQRLKWTSNNQDTLRVDLYHNLYDAVTRGDTNAVGLVKRIVLPRTFTGSPRYMMNNYQDAMALCRAYGNPDLFITFTSNPKWPEIKKNVYLIRFSVHVTVVYVIEFQKRGLPHAHILLWFEEHSKCKTPGEVDDIISAEMPSPTTDPDGYKVVTDYMLHGPCDKDARNAACTSDGKCSKHFPKPFLAETFLDEDGYPHYHRRDNKVTFKKGNFIYDNKHVVPHNLYLLLKYKAHINVEWCNISKAIKYLFKYLNKGPDRATIVIEENVKNETTARTENVLEVDEIKNYLNCQFLAPCKAVWRLFLFDIHYTYPYVMQLSFHLPNQNAITLRDSERLPALRQREGIDFTMFTNWFELNKRDPDAKTLTYADIPKHYVWHEQRERYYLRMLLNVVWGVSGFEELMTVNKRICATFKEACFRYGLLHDDKEWSHVIAEASLWALGPQLQDIFVTMLILCDVSRPLKLWEERWQTLSKDILAKKRIASLLLPAGRTAHSRFVIPLELMENSTCGIKQNTQLAELMQEVFTLTRSIRVNEYSADGAADTTKQEFNCWVLAMGDGTLPAKMKEGEDEPTWIDIPEKFLIKKWDCPIRKIIEETYPDFTSRQTNDEYLKERSILTPRNDDADAIHEFMFKQLSGKYVTYNSADEVCMTSTDNIDQHQLYPVEFLNSLNFPGMPPHELHLKMELPVMLLRNLNPSQGLCNGTRLIITDVGQFVIHAKILTGSHIGDEVVW